MTKPVQPSPNVPAPRPVVARQEEIDAAVTACEAALLNGAAPKTFSAEAMTYLHARYERAFRNNLPRVGGWRKADPALRRVARFLGVMARDIADFHDSPQIDVNHAMVAQNVIENECNLAAGDTPQGREGLICYDLDR